VINLVEEAPDIGVQDPAASCSLVRAAATFGSQAVLDRDGSVLDRTPRAKTERVRLEDRFPFGFQGQLHQALHRSVFEGRDAQGA